MDRELHRAHGQSEQRNGSGEDPSAEFFVNFACTTGHNHEVSATREPGQKLKHRTGGI